MFGIIISVIALLTMGYLILKNYKPQVVLAAAGIPPDDLRRLAGLRRWSLTIRVVAGP